jgi:hypothetical protein
MVNKLQKRLVDLIYGVGRIKTNYLRSHPTEKILAADGSKGITTKGDKEIERGFDWVKSQRAVVLLTDKKIKCGHWDIPLESIESAQLLKISSLFGQGQVLKLKTKDDNHYQFGMQLNPEWTAQNILPLTLKKGQVRTSTFSLILRLILIGYAIYWVLRTFVLI